MYNKKYVYRLLINKSILILESIHFFNSEILIPKRVEILFKHFYSFVNISNNE